MLRGVHGPREGAEDRFSHGVSVGYTGKCAQWGQADGKGMAVRVFRGCPLLSPVPFLSFPEAARWSHLSFAPLSCQYEKRLWLFM